MLRTHLSSLAAGLLIVGLLIVGACTSPQPVDTSEARPSAEEVARTAGERAAKAEGEDLVLYSSSIDSDAANEPVEEPDADGPAADRTADDLSADAGPGDAGTDDADPIEQ